MTAVSEAAEAPAYSDGGTVTFKLLVTVPVFSANPDFTRESVVEDAITHLGEIADYADSHYLATIAEPYEIVSVEPR